MSTAFYNLTIPDQSPTIAYLPSRDGPLTSSWNVTYSNTPDSSYDTSHTSTNLASGISSHRTSLVGATVEVDFMGTAIYLYGSAQAGSYSTSLDGATAVQGSPDGQLLLNATALSYDKHSLVLTVTRAEEVSISYAVLTVGVGTVGSTLQNSTIDAVITAADGTSSLSTFFDTSGNGPFDTGHDATGYSRIDTDGAGGTISITFTSASALFVYGTSNYDHSTYTVTLKPFAGFSDNIRTFNGSSRWFAYDNLIYWEAGLDRDTTYSVSLQNLVGNKFLDVHSVVLLDAIPSNSGNTSTSTSASSSSTLSTTSSSSGSGTGSTGSQIVSESGHSSLSTGAIAGIAVVSAVFVGAVILALFLWRKRQSTRRGYAYNNPGGPPPQNGIIDDYNPYTDFTPPGRSISQPFGTASTTFYDPSQTMGGQASITPFQLYNLGSHATLSSTIQTSSPHLISSSVGDESSSKIPPSVPTQSTIVRREVDAGPVPREEVLPPGYNPSWLAASAEP